MLIVGDSGGVVGVAVMKDIGDGGRDICDASGWAGEGILSANLDGTSGWWV